MRKHTVKEYYTTALFELMDKMPYRKISISDLVRKSGASRASFYRNYETKEQIVDEYLEALFGNIFLKHPMKDANVRQVVMNIMQDIYESRGELSKLEQNGLLDKIDKYIYQDTLMQIQQIRVFNNRYQPYFFAGAASSMIKAWVSFGFEESPEELTELFIRSLAGYMSI